MDPITIAIIAAGVLVIITAASRGNSGAGETTPKRKIIGRELQIAVLGESGSGKTTFFLYLGMLKMKSTEIQPTTLYENTESGKFILISENEDFVQLSFKKAVNIPGDRENRDLYWKKIVNESQVILYLVHASRLLQGEDAELLKKSEAERDREKLKKETEDRVREDLIQLDEWIGKDSKQLIIIGNQFDLIDKTFFLADSKAHYQRQFDNNSVVKEGGKIGTKIIGSFKEKDGFERVIKMIYSIIQLKKI